MTQPRIVGIVAAYNEEGTIGLTVKELLGLEQVGEVVVTADGSTDGTVVEATGAGARVLATGRRRGKGQAVEAAIAATPPAEIYLLVDGDVGQTASEATKLLDAVAAGRLDLAIGRLPVLPGGGFGLVRRMAERLIRSLAGFDAKAPLSGQRAVRREALEACRPLAAGFGLETAMTVDAARLGFRIGEVDVAMTHRPTGRGISGFLHRGGQAVDILRAMLPRALRLR